MKSAADVAMFARGMGIPVSMLRGRMLRWLERTPEERAELLAQGRRTYVCETCEDAGVVWMARTSPDFRPGRIAGFIRAQRPIVNIHAPDEVRVWCDACPPAVQRARQLTGRIAPGDVVDCRFDTFDAYSTSLRNLHYIAARWADRVELRPMLLIAGPAGVGKSHIAKATALRMAESGYTVHFSTAADLLGDIQSAYDRRDVTQPTADEVERRFGAAGVLVIDDLGAEYATAWAATKLEALIFARYERRALTVITANKQLEELAEHQDDPHLRLFDRLSDVRRTVYVTVEGESWRQNGGRPRMAAVR